MDFYRKNFRESIHNHTHGHFFLYPTFSAIFLGILRQEEIIQIQF